MQVQTACFLLFVLPLPGSSAAFQRPVQAIETSVRIFSHKIALQKDEQAQT
jgi:hypothetical protein